MNGGEQKIWISIYLDKAKRHSVSLKASSTEQYNLPFVIKSDKQVFIKSEDPLFNSTNFSIQEPPEI